MQTADSCSAPQEFHLRVVLTRPPSLVATDRGSFMPFHARLLTGRGVGFPQPVMAIHAVLPHYLFSKRNRPLVPFGTADGKYLLTDLFFCQGTIRLPERTEDGEKEFLFSRLYRVRSPSFYNPSDKSFFSNFKMRCFFRLIICCEIPTCAAYSCSVSPS